MALTVVSGSQVANSSNGVAVGVAYFDDGTSAAPQSFTVDADLRSRRGFEAKVGQITAFDTPEQTILAIGLGKREDLTIDILRRAAAAFVKAAAGYEAAETALTQTALDGTNATQRAQAVTEGALLGFYEFTRYKSKSDDRKLTRLTLVDADDTGIERGRAISDAVNLARDLGNTPPVDLNPTQLAEVARGVAQDNELSIIVWDEEDLRAERMGGVLGVAAGSDQPPRFVQLAYKPEGATATVALVGKGITFDSGGLSLKPTEGMVAMKTDMSGAANVIAAMSAIAKLKPKVNVLALAPLTENMPGPSATKIGDVLRARNGKTMEVLNTDAEGRLVLADALSVAVEQQPDAIVDIATLTGACMVALGTDYAGLWSNDDGLKGALMSSADNTGELFWPMPLPDRYRKLLDSEIADMKNIGTRMGGAITAALFLREFVGDVPWVHLDIAGPGRGDAADGYSPKGSTGFGVRTLVDLVENFSRS